MTEVREVHNTTIINSSSALVSETVTVSFNINTELYFQSDLLPTWVTGTFWFVRNVEGFFAISLNLLTIIAVIRFDSLRSNPADIFIAYLSCADFLSGFTGLSGLITFLCQYNISIWKIAVSVDILLRHLTIEANLYGLLALTVDRFLYILKPLRYHQIVTPKRSLNTVIIIWTLIISQIILTAAFGFEFYLEKMPIGPRFSTVHKPFVILLNYAQFFAIMLLIVLIYTWIGIRSWKLSRQVHQISPEYLEIETSSASKDAQQFKAVKTLAIVLGVFILAYLPDGVYSLIVLNFDKGTGTIVIHRILNCVWWINSFANPLIYAWRQREFRKAFNKLLGFNSAVISPETGLTLSSNVNS